MHFTSFLPVLTCAHFLITVLDMVVLNFQLLHIWACNSWNVRKVRRRCFGNWRIAALHQKLTIINNPGTWGETKTLSDFSILTQKYSWAIFTPRHVEQQQESYLK